MNSARLEKSKRLQRVKALLESGYEYSTMDIIQRAQVCAVNSIISELRDNGLFINCQRRAGAFYYQMARIIDTTQTTTDGLLSTLMTEPIIYDSGIEQDKTLCIAPILGGGLTSQCQNKRGCGPGGEYCGKHAMRLKRGLRKIRRFKPIQ